MDQKHILIADADTKAWETLRQAMGEGWSVSGADNGVVAMAEAQRRAPDVVVANFDLPGMGGAELLNRIRSGNPRSIRFIAAAEESREKVMCHVLGGHQFLALPLDRATLKNMIERSIAADFGMTSGMREMVSRIRAFPTIPSLYLEVVNALKSPSATTEDIGAIIGKDMAMTTKLVQVLNSAYFGLSRTITDPTEAVGILGFDTTKSLIMTIKLLSQYDKVKPVYFSIDNIWRHSTNVARSARVMALLEVGDNDCIASAYTAGLMHDLGKVILAANFDTQYHGAHNMARKRKIPLWEVEKDIFGVTHGEIGAYLLGLWGMPAEVVRVAALHHHPARSEDKSFSALTAVHVANALENETNPDPEGLPPATVDLAYLRQVGLDNRVDLWREARNDPDATKFQTKMQMQRSKTAASPSSAAAPAKTATPLAVPQGPKPLRLSPPTPSHNAKLLGLRDSPRHAWQNWLYIGLGATAVLALLAWMEFTRLQNTTPKYDQQDGLQTSPQTAALIAPPQPIQELKPAPASRAEEIAHPPPAVTDSPKLPPPPRPVPPTNPAPLATVKPAPPPVTAIDKLKLQAIFFTPPHPAALINGQLVNTDQEVTGCRVLEISPTSVTLEFQKHRKTLTLR